MSITVEKGGEPLPDIEPIRTRTVEDRIAEAEHVADEKRIPVAEALLNESRRAREVHGDVLCELRHAPEEAVDYLRGALSRAAKEIGQTELALILWGARAEATIHELRRRER